MMLPMGELVVGLLVAIAATSNLFLPSIDGTFLSDPTLLAFAGGTLAGMDVWVRSRAYVGRAHWLLISVFAAFLPGMIFAASHEYGGSKVQGLLLAFVLTWFATQLLTTERARRAFLRTVAVLGLLVAAALWVFGEASTYGGRVSVAGLNPIGLGRMAAAGALIAAVAGFYARGWRRASLLLLCALAGYVAASTGSRGPVLAGAMSLLLTLLLSRQPRGRGLRVLGGIGAVAAGYLLLTQTTVDASRFLSTDSSGRDALWERSLAVAADSPAGVGFGNLYDSIVIPRDMLDAGYRQYSHNVLIEVLVEGGWVAFVAFVVLLVVSFRALIRDSTTPLGAAMLALWLFAFANACVSSDLVGNRLMWAMIGAGLALYLRRSLADRRNACGPASCPPTEITRRTRRPRMRYQSLRH